MYRRSFDRLRLPPLLVGKRDATARAALIAYACFLVERDYGRLSFGVLWDLPLSHAFLYIYIYYGLSERSSIFCIIGQPTLHLLSLVTGYRLY